MRPFLSSPLGGALIAAITAVLGISSLAWLSHAAEGMETELAVVFPLTTDRSEAFARITRVGGSPLREGGAEHVIIAHFDRPPDDATRDAMGALALLDPGSVTICGAPVQN